ncbi:hypothetical protein [Microbacterium aurantiacum]|uniref:hypothetical protein n=1 Tax=Microbacterium aurantiacum TaxID=162393 RepID=UPI000C7F7C1E|nr:hypothetical protein [Microbacterium aurantiacum]
MALLSAASPVEIADEPFRRRGELILAGIGLTASAVLQGGFAFVVTRSDDETLRSSILPGLRDAGMRIADAEAHVIVHTVAAWFGFSFAIVALLAAIGFFFAVHAPRSRSTGWWFLAAGLACLFGTQFVLYPVAFFLFLAAALFAVRTPPPRSST